MAKARASKPKSAAAAAAGLPGPATDPTARIAEIDSQLLALLQERAQLVVAGAGQHAEHGHHAEHGRAGAGEPAAFASDLDEQLLTRLLQTQRGPLPRRCLRAIFREVLSGCRSLVRPTRVAFLGPLYSYSHLAAIHRFGRSLDFVPVGTIAAVFEEIHRGHSDFGLVPVENSTDGRIADTLDMFTRLPVRICGEVEIEIHHTLLGKCPRTELQEIYSRPQALSQCRNWLAKHLPAARTIEVTSTSTAAQLAAEKPGAAAIASLQAGVEYGLLVLAENIEDNPGNTTRFALIGGLVPEPTGNDRTAVLFQVEHRPGALAEAMNIFKRHKLNLTWIESFPAPLSKRTYLFFAEMEAHQTDGRFRRAMAMLRQKALRLEILGSFPATTTVE
jgi:chorismate mutase/prephenate dehydratase